MYSKIQFTLVGTLVTYVVEQYPQILFCSGSLLIFTYVWCYFIQVQNSMYIFVELYATDDYPMLQSK